MPSKINKIQKKNPILKGNTTKIKPVPKKINIHGKKTLSPDDEKMLNKIQPSGKREESFFELVYEVARQIPYGRVTSYGAIAACLGTKLSARLVGWAMNGADKINPTVPAHRVVNRVGLLSGKHHFKPPGKMEKLLKKEGILVKDDVIIDFKEKFWDPGKLDD
ncbi:MAG TPA: MGMT family protein [Candidatus Paceibacterota bacterium]|jgi:methylated-DNA-protein-cysteine methyltransferase-like protein|nr:MGMT family protein [Candidatus Paceibacterota bacterium]